ncbi:MAG: dTDP-4-dehydrorhamnose 3,5-epimerase family protein [Bdellovibrionota bacterium]
MAIQLIEGVRVKNLRLIPDDRGFLMEMLRRDDPDFKGFGQTYLSCTYPGVVKAWHFHKQQWDAFVCVSGMIKLVVFDSREGSPTRGKLNEFFIGDQNRQLVHIPPGCYHGWKNIGTELSYVVNVPSEPYHYESPDEYRLDPHKNDLIPYDWSRKDG